jgi:beta-phosphoglucomutase-like phosphatase (HAD superfamily)
VREARAILFDLDGVLVDSYAVWFHLLAALAEELGYPPIGAEAFRAGWGQGIEADVRDFFPRHGTAALERLYAERLGRHLEHLVVPAEVPAVFAALRARRMGSAVVTNSPAGMARLLLERAGATPDVLVGGTDVPRPKPAPDSVLHACAGASASSPAPPGWWETPPSTGRRPARPEPASRGSAWRATSG